MVTPYIGEIRMFSGNFAPQSWAFCHGQLISIPQNDALFSLIGTTYGGDGRTTFGLPDLRSRIPVHADGTYKLGSKGGEEQVTLTTQQIPSHSHVPQGQAANGSSPPTNSVWAASAQNIYTDTAPALAMNADVTDLTGGGRPHDNRMPFLAINFIIALYGIYPSRQ